MRNKNILTAGILALALLAPGFFLTPSAHAGPGKKRAEQVPDSALEPPYGREYVEKRIQAFTLWARADFPVDFSGKTTLRDLKKKQASAGKTAQHGKGKEKIRRRVSADPSAGNQEEEKKEYRFTKIEFRRHFSNLENLLASSPYALDDLEEVTGVKRDYFLMLRESALKLYHCVSNAEVAQDAGDEESFRECMREYLKRLHKYEICLKAKRKRLSRKEWDILIEKNEKRRRAAWLKDREQQLKIQRQKARRTEGKTGK